MTQKIVRSDIDFNNINWHDDRLTIVRESATHIQISRYQHLISQPAWSISIDATSGRRMLHVDRGNRLACVNEQHLLALTCGQYGDDGSLHNRQLHYISLDGQILWSRPWHVVERFTIVEDFLLVLRYPSTPHFWIDDVPIEAHLLDPATGESVHMEQIHIPEQLKPHYQSWQVTELKSYLVWKQDRLLLTVRPYFRSHYEPALELANRGSFKHFLSFKGMLPTA